MGGGGGGDRLVTPDEGFSLETSNLSLYFQALVESLLTKACLYYCHYHVCDVTLSVYPHRASLKNMPDHSRNRTYDRWNTSPMLCQLS